MSNQEFIDWLLTLIHQSSVSKQIVKFHLVSSLYRSFNHAHFNLKLITPTVEDKRSDFETYTWTWTRTPLFNSNFWKLTLNCICSKSSDIKFAFSQAWQGRLRPTVLWSWGNLLVNHDGRSCEWRSQKYAKIHALKQFCTCLDSCTCQDYIIYALTVCMLTKPPCNAENLIICLLLTPREKMHWQMLLLSLEANLHNR